MLRVMIESYMPIAFATGISIVNIKAENTVDKVNAIICIVWGLYLLYVPYYFYRFLRNYRGQLPSQTIKDQFSSLYLNVDYYKLQALCLTLL